VPFCLTGWASLAVLAAWLLVPLLVGYRRFSRADL
jgi:ABC-2 type transport system permease protein